MVPEASKAVFRPLFSTKPWNLSAGGAVATDAAARAGAVGGLAGANVATVTAAALPHTVTGDRALAEAILRAATTLGCD